MIIRNTDDGSSSDEDPPSDRCAHTRSMRPVAPQPKPRPKHSSARSGSKGIFGAPKPRSRPVYTVDSDEDDGDDQRQRI